MNRMRPHRLCPQLSCVLPLAGLASGAAGVGGSESSHFTLAILSTTVSTLVLGVAVMQWAKGLLGLVRASTEASTSSCPAKNSSSDSHSPATGADDRVKIVQRFLDHGRAAVLLRPQIATNLDAEQLAVVRRAFDDACARVDPGAVMVADWTCEESEPLPGQAAFQTPSVSGCFMDRCAVTNRQYAEFVAEGAYLQQPLWDASVWSRVSEFVDRTGRPGPRYWEHGKFPAGEDELPVTGISWYEADAYARWTGKRLPTDAEWVKAAACPSGSSAGEASQRRFPWGDNLDAQRANLWMSGVGRPVAVREFPAGATSDGVLQLVGNVWEWTASDVAITSYGRQVQFETPTKGLRGGAFDTYFENQATTQLQSGDSAFARRPNIGFRCAVSAADILDGGTSP